MPHSAILPVGGPGPKILETQSATVSTTALPLSDAAFGFTAGILAKANRAIISSHTNAVHYRWDGTSPTATVGHHLDDSIDGHDIILGNANINALEVIREGGADATVTVTLEE